MSVNTKDEVDKHMDVKMVKEFKRKDGIGATKVNGKRIYDEEFNLSEFRSWIEAGSFEGWIYPEEDIKEFIKRLRELRKQRLENYGDYIIFCEDIDKLAGDKLI